MSGSLLLVADLDPGAGVVPASKPESHANPWLMRVLTLGYSKLLSFCLHRPQPVYATAVAGVVLAVIAYMAVGKAFMPSMDEGSVIMQTTKLPSISLPRSLETDTLIQRTLRERIPEIKEIIARSAPMSWASTRWA